MKLRAKDGVRGISLMGVEYVNDAEGCVVVPDEHVDVALANGYEPLSHVAAGLAADDAVQHAE